jgi:hypothetical protein
MGKLNGSRHDSGRKRRGGNVSRQGVNAPNNTAPDGTITKALQGLTALSNELAKNSGINDPLTNWLEQWLGEWEER